MKVNSVELVQLTKLLQASAGSPEIAVGLIDGPVDATHREFQEVRLETVVEGTGAACTVQGSPACVHGTFVAGLLTGRRSSQCPAICPQSPLLVRPIFCEASDLSQCPAVTAGDLASALTETVDAGAKVINLSVGFGNSAIEFQPLLNDSLNYAISKGVLIIAASGNRGRVGNIPLFEHPWVIPVGACDENGNVVTNTNIGSSLGKRGLLAPGVNVTSTAPADSYTTMTGTSVAAPFVTGTVVLLWSLFRGASAEQVRRAILLPAIRRKTIIPPVLDAEASWRALREEL
jgi:subtilisin family serine protease